MMIDFKNLIVGRHESKVLFTWNLENGGAVLGAFLGIKDGIETILARDGITPASLYSSKSFAQSQQRTIGTSRPSEAPLVSFRLNLLMARKSSSKL